MAKVNKWQLTKDFINKHDEVFTKKEMKEAIGVKITGTIGSYISHLKSLGFVQMKDVATYQRIKNIPEDMTSAALAEMPW